MTAVDRQAVADACTRKINTAMAMLPAGIALEARARGEHIEVALMLSDEAGDLIDARESRLTEDLVTAASVATAARLDAFLAASARWLAAQPLARREELYPHDVFVPATLADPRLTSFDDFVAVLDDPARREAYVARAELGAFFARHALAAPDDDEELRALYALTPEGRASKGLPASVRAVSWLATTAWGQRALVMMMHEWASAPYEPWDVPWQGGPITTQLLLCGAWRVIDPVLVDDGLRRRALDAFDRLPRPVGPSELTRAGF